MASLTTPTIQDSGPTAAAPPLVIREALAEDREPAWTLQRAAFNLPEGDPPPHPGHRQELRVAVRGRQVVSCLTLIHAELCMRGARLPMGGIRHVATHPEEQNQGYASTLMRDTLQRSRAAGLVTSVLFPFSFRYYRKFGYELGGSHCHYWCRPNCIPPFVDRARCRKAGPEDAPALNRYYQSRSAGACCTLARDERRWAALCADPAYTVVLHANPEVSGFAVLADARDRYGGRILKVLDLSAAEQPAWRALLGYLSQTGVESIEWLACGEELIASGLLRSPAPLREGFKPRGIATVRPMFQFRVVDLEGALRARAPAFPHGKHRLAFQLRDDLIPENTVPVAVQTDGEQVEIRPARPTDPYLEADIRIFSQLFCGYMSPSDAVAQELARCSSPAALETADLLFPAGEPFLSELDRF